MAIRGTDASGADDEPPPEGLMEFSDDEEEAEVSRYKPLHDGYTTFTRLLYDFYTTVTPLLHDG